jgi:hypothetical protein
MRLGADDECRQQVLELINRINYSMVAGNFEMDPANGDIRFRMAVNCDGLLPSRQVVAHSIMVPCAMMEKYGNAFAQVIMGMNDAAAAFALANDQPQGQTS